MFPVPDMNVGSLADAPCDRGHAFHALVRMLRKALCVFCAGREDRREAEKECSMDYTSEMAELLARHGFRRFAMSRSGVGHLLLAGQLDARPIPIVLDTGAGKTFVELSYCRAEGISVTD